MRCDFLPYKVLLQFVFSLMSCQLSAQDLIVRKDGVKIFCEIVKEDSASIFYVRAGNKNTSEMSRIDIEKYYINKTPGVVLPTKEKKFTNGNVQEKNKEPEVKDLKKLLFTAFVGSAKPVAVFASNDLSSDKAGFATSGLVYGLKTVLKVTNYLGFSASYQMQSCGFDASVFQNYLNTRYKPIVHELHASDWQINGFFGGIYFNTSAKTDKKLFVDFDLMVGFPKVKLPRLETVATYNGLKVIDVQEATPTNAFMFLPGLGIHYRLTDELAFALDANFLKGKAVFGNFTQTTNGAMQSVGKFEQQIVTLNIQFGIVLRL